MNLKTLISSLPSTSAVTIKKLKSVGVNTFEDLINYFPSRYNDVSVVSKIGFLQEGEQVTIQGKVIATKQIYTRRHITIQEIIVEDETGKITVTWFNQPYILKTVKKDVLVSISGKVKKSKIGLTFEPLEFELLEKSPLIHTGRITPVYPEKRGLSSHTLRSKIHFVLQNISQEEYLPKQLTINNQLLAINNSYQHIHFPETKTLLSQAKKRLSFDELFTLQLSSELVKQSWKQEKTSAPLNILIYRKDIDEFIKHLPFTLTNDQNKVLDDMISDLGKPQPMNRFVQGDVGSGKTVVAAIGCYIAHLNGFQSLIMAPTEILAQQHYATLTKLFAKTNLKVDLITGNQKTKSSKLQVASSNVIVGTHALLNKQFDTSKVAFVVIDEQHRFGVRQRSILKSKGINPHLLTMTATPIPRTTALALYGELDLSVISEMPKGRIPIKSFLVPKEKRKNAYEWIQKHVVEQKAQVFVICPLIEESEKETMQSVRAATKEFDTLSKSIFPKLKLGLLHGRMKSDEKERVMQGFKNKEFSILVSTSVVEVGIDIPDATIIVIEGAERFGLAQLHQLRGRVGRSNIQSYCLLFTETIFPHVQKRLSYFAQHTSGFEIAEYDLTHRGEGEIHGTKQHGVTELKIASLADFPLIEQTRSAVKTFIENYQLSDYSLLKERVEKRGAHEIAHD